MLNAANSTVGQAVIQLCHLLRLRCVAIIRQRDKLQQHFKQKAVWLQSLGADLVLEDAGSLKVGTHDMMSSQFTQQGSDGCMTAVPKHNFLL